MRKILLTLFVCNCIVISFSQTIIKKDPAIEAMVAEVNADSLKNYILKMVSFGTRNTLSTQTDPKRGIGAARLWVLSKFNEFVKKIERATFRNYRYHHITTRWPSREYCYAAGKCRGHT